VELLPRLKSRCPAAPDPQKSQKSAAALFFVVAFEDISPDILKSAKKASKACMAQ
jgi:hypothetical protein